MWKFLFLKLSPRFLKGPLCVLIDVKYRSHTSCLYLSKDTRESSSMLFTRTHDSFFHLKHITIRFHHFNTCKKRGNQICVELRGSVQLEKLVMMVYNRKTWWKREWTSFSFTFLLISFYLTTLHFSLFSEHISIYIRGSSRFIYSIQNRVICTCVKATHQRILFCNMKFKFPENASSPMKSWAFSETK